MRRLKSKFAKSAQAILNFTKYEEEVWGQLKYMSVYQKVVVLLKQEDIKHHGYLHRAHP